MRTKDFYVAFLLVFLYIKSHAQEPRPFLKDLMSVKVEYGVTVSPDKKTVYFVETDSFYTSTPSRIMNSVFKKGVWSKPKRAFFSTHDSDSSPFISPDGEVLFFTSKRPISDVRVKNSNIWKVQLQGPKKGVTTPIKIVNSNESEYSPSVDSKGNLYFGSYREGGEGSGDLWWSEFKNGKYTEPQNLGNIINTPNGEWGSCISPNGQFLIFENSGNENNLSGEGDLYLSTSVNGSWQVPIHLSAPINSEGSDLTPKIHNGILYYASNRKTDSTGKLLPNDVDLYSINLSNLINQFKNE